ncbi:MAG: LPS assembly protein LptD [Gammaproteobacteria bacterium]|nr:LPS assembly protein LptD [Gammaproteobacteria bacterium]
MQWLKRTFCLILGLFFVFSSLQAEDQNAADIAKMLGWVDTSNLKQCPTQNSCVNCGGYYDESNLPQPSNIGFKDAQVVIHAPPPIHYQLNGSAEFTNGVSISQPGRSLQANQATITPDIQTGKLKSVSATGNVRLEQPGQIIVADSLDANLINHQASMTHVHYLLRVGADNPRQTMASPTTNTNFTGYAHGNSETVKQLNADQYTLDHASYSTCSPLTRTWELDANQIDLDQSTGEGQAKDTFLKFNGIPVFYFPYISFPINSDRKSGFLYGGIGQTGSSGVSLSTPYYFNLAPNYDDTLTPTLYTKRGLLLDNSFRYLTPSSQGSIEAEMDPYDPENNGQFRYGYILNNTTNLDSWQSNLNYNQIGDDNFLNDFNVMEANQVLLNRSFSVSNQTEHWNFNGLLQSYQVVNSQLTTANTPYTELPNLNVGAQYPNVLGPLSFSMDSSAVNFSKNGNGTPAPVEGQRLNVTPEVSLPLTASYGYFTPSISFDSTQYHLQNYTFNNFSDQNPNINLPILNVDTSAYFDRPLSWGLGQDTQSLQPRLFYLYVPYENQNNIPIFDTTIIPFNYSQLFASNRFSGLDRMGDANQLSYALSSTINNQSGQQLLSGGLGQTWYFENRQVSLCQNQPGQAPCIQNENPNYATQFSDIAAYFTYNFNPVWSFNANATYDANYTEMDLQEYTVTYAPGNNLFNLSYQSNRQNYGLLSTEQIQAGSAPPASSLINGSFVWNINEKWAILGSLNYSIENNGTVSEFTGLQYSSCCWAIRLLAYKYVVNNNPNTPNVMTGPMTTAFMLQFLLKGLGNLSTSGAAATQLLATIPGYNGQLGF